MIMATVFHSLFGKNKECLYVALDAGVALNFEYIKVTREPANISNCYSGAERRIIGEKPYVHAIILQETTIGSEFDGPRIPVLLL